MVGEAPTKYGWMGAFVALLLVWSLGQDMQEVRRAHRLADGKSGTATVTLVENDESRNPRWGKGTKVVYTYEVDDANFEQNEVHYSPPNQVKNLKVGEQVQIVYDPRSPSLARMGTNNEIWLHRWSNPAFIVGVIGILACALSLLSLLIWLGKFVLGFLRGGD